ncbi:MAG: hypothetical protein F6J94_11115 [Moorea sp. SIO1F2]|nr:hypothetical protein [Moorena sp. SIO1F2]NET82458.1 hypothetical protein [Moorena sp. SIO1F2]
MKHFYLLVSEKFFSFNLPYNEYGANYIQPLTFKLLTFKLGLSATLREQY